MKQARRIAEWILLAALLIPSMDVRAQAISYMIPDLGTPGMNTYVEILGPHDQIGNYGPDGFYMNNPGDAVRVECVNAADTTKIGIGPLVVSWNGRMISTQIFVHPDQQPNSDSWQGIAPEFIIPLQVRYNGVTQNSVTFYIVRPQPAIVTNAGGTIGSGGVWALRSPRGAIIIDSLALLGDSYDISTADCDPATPGNQGFLPVVILSKGPVRTGNNTQVSVDANAKHGGPGGGGGGGNFCDWSGSGADGGDGFTGGGRGGRNRAGNPFGSDEYRNPGAGSGTFIGNTGGSLNGVPGGDAPAYEASAGGTGHPFGSSGNGCGDGGGCNPPGGHGGGSGQQQQQAGGAGGYATAGTSSQNGNGGQPHGNESVIPLAGGSGGASGNPQLAFSCSGDGGGGGGALRLFAPRLEGQLFTSNGAGGSDGASGDGGSGSGGAVSLESKLASGIWKIRAEGGIGVGPRGGAGRIRMDGPMMWFSNAIPTEETMFHGPSTDTTTFVRRQFTISGTGNGADIQLYLKSDRMPWTSLGTVRGYSDSWTFDIDLPAEDNVYYFVALQQVSTPSSDPYVASPVFVMSQAAANIFISRTTPELLAENARQLPGLVCDDNALDTLSVSNVGDGLLYITNARFASTRGFVLVEPTAFPISIDPGMRHDFIVRFTRQGSERGRIVDTLLLESNTPAPGPFSIAYAIDVDVAEMRVSTASIAFPDVILCESDFADATFDIENTGTVPLTFAIPVIDNPAFVIQSPAPSLWPRTVPPGATLTVGLRVTHATSGSLGGTIRLAADEAGCGIEAQVTLSARAMRVDLSVSTLEEFPRLHCFGEFADSTVIIRNDGEVDYTVTQITSQDPSFLLLSPVPPVFLAAGAQLEAHVRFAPSAPGTHAGNLRIAIDRCGMTHDLLLRGTRDSVGLTVAAADFGLQRAEDLPVVRMVRVTNSGSTAVTISSATDIPPFRVIGGLPVNLTPGSSVDLRVQFDDPGIDEEFDVSMPLDHGPSCSPQFLRVHGIRGSAVVELVVDTLSAEPGEQIEIPLRLRNGRNIALFGATGIRATLRYRSSLLVPLGGEQGSITGNERSIDLTIPLLTDAEDVALRVPMMVTLGDAEYTDLRIENVAAIGGDLTINTQDGRFTLLGICRDGGTRLFDGSVAVQLKPNRPNPFNPATTLEFVLIEAGQTSLRIVDALGREVVTLADGWLEPGTHVRNFNGSGLPSGVYLAVLQTPTIVRHQRMLLMK
ncbi:MAG: choice-of-anchor D domain-containing protein [Bacteroidota bacterium]|jgi:hypothetical protein|nr:choice-of-anchor D domain-containing protein [Bacteroidota bacterium]